MKTINWIKLGIAANLLALLVVLINNFALAYRTNKGGNITVDFSSISSSLAICTFACTLGYALLKYEIKSQQQLQQNEKLEQEHQQWLQQNERREQEHQLLTKGCQGCKYFHGKHEIICAVHPQGQINCSDCSQV